MNPQHIKGINGYKTDPKDAQWIAGLLVGGRLKGSLVPPREISSVATDLFGFSGRTMLKALVEGKLSVGWMAERAKPAAEQETGVWLETKVEVLEQEIERRVAPFEESMRRLTTIPGIDRKTAWMIVAGVRRGDERVRGCPAPG